MSSTPHLALPLLAAAQAQKHVTHNEALTSLDALLHLAVKEKNRTSAPARPEEGDRYLVGAGGAGVFAGHENEIALFDLGVWRFFTPRPGWRAYVEAEDRILAFDGVSWRDLGHYGRDLSRAERLGIGTAPDDLNRIAAKLNATLFSALTTAEGGTGDLRFVLNKTDAGNVLSQLYQRGFSGRAETGLIGSDDFSLRVSPDGSQWRDALRVDCNSGFVSFPSGTAALPNANLLINSNFLVNQRASIGGTIASGYYTYDRWKAGSGGGTFSRATDGTMTFSGSLDQIVDVANAPAMLGSTTFANRTLTLSVEDPTAPLSVTIGSKTATIPAGAGRRSATVTLGASDTGHITVRFQSSVSCSFKCAKLELGPNVTPWVAEPFEVEELRCRRYYQRISAGGGPPMVLGALAQRVSTNIIDIPFSLPVPMRAAPTLATSGLTWANASPSGNQAAFFDNVAGTWAVQTGGVTLTAAVAGLTSVVLRFLAGTSFTGAAGSIGNIYFGNVAYIGLQAEL
ncbi:DUF2793 domain-containing protein [Microvirga terricola]|uniref:DUF2793 domain-containing protein n=1 Tax=Microvirga terricola TaxID=2719797 RepID=A0ABX0VEZ0_9HYPH|nr:DUF2793 domain-containing protein [Microvirga terricola]NIX76906.1 DUF2793 domain-containing protein [Microvirga terricola]